MDKKKMFYVVQPGTNSRVFNGKDPLILDETGKLNRELNRVDEEIISVEDYENKFTEPERHESRYPNYISRLKGRDVVVTLYNNDIIQGKVDGFTPWEIRIKTAKGRDVLVFKHSIVQIDGDFSKSGKGVFSA